MSQNGQGKTRDAGKLITFPIQLFFSDSSEAVKERESVKAGERELIAYVFMLIVPFAL